MTLTSTPTLTSAPRAGRATGRVAAPVGPPRMGYQPSLDGLRALSVGIVLFYHGGFSWMHGGFFGVEVFFVVSGFLITSLLIEEHDRHGSISFSGFWTRRARRLLPALFAVLVAVAAWAVLAGSAAQQSQLRRDIPWSVFYVGNWGQILGDVPYFAGDPPLLRHLWSLAVEEQWYLIWPLVFVGIIGLGISHRARGAWIMGAGVAVFVLMFWIHRNSPSPLGGPPSLFEGLNRTNFLYLSTITRAGGLLLGAGAAFWWRPWRWANASAAPIGRHLDPIGAAALTMIACAAAVAQVTAGYVYQWLLPLVSILSLVAIMVAVHPAAVGMRRILSWRPLVEIGKRSYGLYLWSWPIFVILGATDGSVPRFVLAMTVTVAVTEASYRWLETPVRKGAVGDWWSDRTRDANYYAPVAGAALVIGCLAVFYATVDPFDPFKGGGDATFALADGDAPEDGQAGDSVPAAIDPSATVDPSAAAGSSAADDSADADDPSAAAGGVPVVPDATTLVPTSTITPATSANLAIVGDSQAHALAINLPDGIDSTFPNIANGAVLGCGIYDEGHPITTADFATDYGAYCQGWADEWAAAAAGADVTLVVLGAWDVFDMSIGGAVLSFGSPASDADWMARVQTGIDRVLATGSKVALLPAACMRPIQVMNNVALPERGDDSRIAHVNELLAQVADSYGTDVVLLDGPPEWCNDEAIATNLNYRWDGVHVYTPGADLIYEKVAPQLLQLAASP